MDAYSSLSKYHADKWIYGYAVLISTTHFSCLSFSASLFTFPPFSSTNSEEAKSTTWLHPVTGEAVITGHRKTPGKQFDNVFLLHFLRKHTHTLACTPRLGKVISASRRRKKGRQVAGRAVEDDEGEISSLCSKSNSLLCSAPLSARHWRTITHGVSPPLPPHYSLHLDTLRHTF